MMIASALICALLGLYDNVDASRGSRRQASWCTTPRVRQEWRNLNSGMKKNYIESVKCMMNLPSQYQQLMYPGLKSRYDEFVVMHANATGGGMNLNRNTGWDTFAFQPTAASYMMQKGIYGTATSILWHRWFLSLWEDALNKECGWKGGIPYWDWYLDTPDRNGSSFERSPVFSAVDGFGGNGVQYSGSPPWAGVDLSVIPGLDPVAMRASNGGGCVKDGPFANHALRVGPMGAMAEGIRERCLRRDLNLAVAHAGAGGRSMEAIFDASNFTEFREWVEYGHSEGSQASSRPYYTSLYAVGYGGIGGEMSDIFNAVNDPLFFLHYANIDRIWRIWQQASSTERLYDASVHGSYDSNAALNTILHMGVFAPSVPVRYIMDTESRNGEGVICYRYAGLAIKDYVGIDNEDE